MSDFEKDIQEGVDLINETMAMNDGYFKHVYASCPYCSKSFECKIYFMWPSQLCNYYFEATCQHCKKKSVCNCRRYYRREQAFECHKCKELTMRTIPTPKGTREYCHECWRHIVDKPVSYRLWRRIKAFLLIPIKTITGDGDND